MYYNTARDGGRATDGFAGVFSGCFPGTMLLVLAAGEVYIRKGIRVPGYIRACGLRFYLTADNESSSNHDGQ